LPFKPHGHHEKSQWHVLRAVSMGARALARGIKAEANQALVMLASPSQWPRVVLAMALVEKLSFG
jgi:hypothetical protein